MPFEVAIVEPPEVPTYIGIADKALHLKELNMNPNQIAVALKVDRTTVLRVYAGSRAYRFTPQGRSATEPPGCS